MIRASILILLVGFLCLLSFPQVSAQSDDYELAQLTTERKTHMFEMERAYWVLLDLERGKTSDYTAAEDAAREMSERIELFLLLMRPGTARGEAPGSRAKPEVWSQPETFAATAQAFRDSAIALAETAAGQDAEAYKEKFKALTGACTGCHGFRPSSGGPFRFAKDE